MDNEQLLSFLEKNHVSFREMINYLPLGARPGELWPELISRRRAGSVTLPLHDANGHPYWYVTTDRMVAASQRVIEEYIAQKTAFDPFRAEVPASLLEEAYYTSYVEGFSLTLHEAMAFLQANREPEDIREQILLNNRNTLLFLSANLYPEVNERYFQAVSYYLTEKMDNGDGRFRQEDTQRIPFMRNERYSIPPAMGIMDRLREIIRFLGDNTVHPLIRAAVGHLWPIAAQPFREGNERLGRMVSLLALYRAGYTFLGDVSLSSLISRSSYAYYNALSNILREENGGDLTYFIAYFLELLAKAAEERPAVIAQREEQRRIMEQTGFGEENAIVTEGTVDDPIVEEKDSAGKRKSRGTAQGEMNGEEGGDAVSKKLQTVMREYTGYIAEYAKALYGFYVSGRRRFTVSDLCAALPFDIRVVWKHASKLTSWEIIRKAEGSSKMHSIYEFASSPSIASEAEARRYLSGLRNTKNPQRAAIAEKILSYLDQGRRSFSYWEIKRDAAPFSVTPCSLANEFGCLGTYLSEEGEGRVLRYVFTWFPPGCNGCEEQEDSPQSEERRFAWQGDSYGRARELLQNAARIPNKTIIGVCAAQLIQFLESDRYQFTNADLCEATGLKTGQAYYSLTKFRQIGAIGQFGWADSQYDASHKCAIYAFLPDQEETQGREYGQSGTGAAEEVHGAVEEANKAVEEGHGATKEKQGAVGEAQGAVEKGHGATKEKQGAAEKEPEMKKDSPRIDPDGGMNTQESEPTDIIARMKTYIQNSSSDFMKTQIMSFLLSHAERGVMEFTIADISSATSLPRKNISDSVQKLKKKGYILAAGQAIRGGRLVSVYSINYRMEPPSPAMRRNRPESSVSAPAPHAQTGEYDPAVIQKIRELQSNTASPMDRRIGSMLTDCLERGVITGGDYPGALSAQVRRKYMRYASQIGLVAATGGGSYKINKQLRPDYSTLNPLYIDLLQMAWRNYGKRVFTRSMICGDLDYAFDTVSGALRELAVMGILEREIVDGELRYRLLIIPQDRPECFHRKPVPAAGMAEDGPLQRQAFARTVYDTFGDGEFSREMIIASVDYKGSSLGAVLHDLTALKILGCREDGYKHYQYKFLVNPQDNPEFFMAESVSDMPAADEQAAMREAAMREAAV